MSNKRESFDDLIKQWDVKLLDETQPIKLEENREVIESVENSTKEVNDKFEIQRKKTISRISKPLSIITFLFILVLIYMISPLSRVKDIVIVGNQSLDTSQIRKIANIHVNDNLTTIYTFNIKKNLESNDLISRAYIKKDLFSRKVIINVHEVTGLFYYKNNNAKYLVDKNLTTQVVKNDVVNFPKFTNYLNIKNEYITDFINELKKVKASVLNQISEIQYKPNSTFKNRFLLKMNDRNYIYLLSKNVAYKLNYYQELRRVIVQSSPVDIYFENASYYKTSDR